MRKILILYCFALVACESSLELEPKMYIQAEEAFSNSENINAALIGCYDALQLQHYYGRNLILVGDLLSDNSKASGTKIEYYSTDDNNLLADNILVEGIWSDIYSAINRANYMLYKLTEVDFLSDEAMWDIRGQLSFLRALHYFNLVRLYGEVPLKLLPTLDENESNYLPRSFVIDIYKSIEDDLGIAINFITNTQPERATQAAAKTLLSLVYLCRGNYQLALEYSMQVYDSFGFIEKDYSELFGNKAEPSSEILFYIPFSATDKNRLAEYLLPNQLGGRYENSPTPKLISMLEANDIRAEYIASLYKDKYYTRKYTDLSTGSDNVLVFRNAELLFIMAEAAYYIDSLANAENITDYMNTIRIRAGLDSLETLNSGSIWNEIDKQRQLEFAFEGKRWFDLIRTNRAIGTVPTISSANQMLLPIPLSEILANPKIPPEDQNEGY